MADKVKVFKYKIIDESGNVVEESTSKLSVLEAAVKKTSEALKGADIGSKNFKDLKDNLEQNEKAFAKADAKSKGLTKTLEGIPGPIGQVAQGFTGMGKAATAFIANPIGAVIALAGVIFAAFTKAIKNSEAATDSLTKITAIFSGIIRPVFAFIEDIAVATLDNLAKGLEVVAGWFGETGKAAGKYTDELDNAEDAEKDLAVSRAETNKQLAEAREILSDTNASYDDRVAALKKVQSAEEAQSKAEIDNKRELAKLAQDDIDLNGKSEEAVQKLRDAKIALASAEQDGAAKQRLFNKEQKKLDGEKDAADKARAKEAEDRRKEDLANRKAAADKIRQLDQENQLASIEDEKAREVKAQEFAKAAALREIEQMKLTKQEKARLIEEIDEKNKLKLAEINDKYVKEQEKKDEENAAKKAKFEEDVAKALADTREEKFALEKQETQKQFDDLIALAGADTEKGKALIEARDAKLKELQTTFNAETLEMDRKKTEDAAKIALAEAQAKANAINASLDIAAQAGALLSQIAGKNKKLAIAGVIVEQGAAVGKVITSTQIANAGTIAAFPGPLAPAAIPIIIKNNISAGLSIATIVAGAAKAISDINKAEVGDEAQKSEGKKIATSYAQGGLLTGRGHGQGGIATPMGELEGGEFVVNRKSTASFLPLLSSINEMGAGGVLGMGNISSGIENAGLNSPPPIIKTYVLASDVSSQQEADKMISDLARL